MKLFLSLLLVICVAFSVLWWTAARVASQTEQSYPPAGEFLSVDGQRIHYFDSAAGELQDAEKQNTIILLHGASTSLHDFMPTVIPALSDRYRVVAFDRPGLGYSERGAQWMSPQDQAELILKATRQLDIPSALWLGHSWAGSVVLAAARQNPVEMSGAILLAPMTHDWQTGVSWHVSLASAPVVGPVFSSTLVPIVGRGAMAGAIASVFEPEAVPTDYRANTAVELSLRPDHFRNNAADVARASDWLSINSRYYADIDIPVLSITGSADSVVPSWNHTERLSQQVKDLSWHVIEGAGHALHHTRIEEIGDLIDQFISDLNGTER